MVNAVGDIVPTYQNHRMVEVGRNLGRSCSVTPAPSLTGSARAEYQDHVQLGKLLQGWSNLCAISSSV